MFSFGTKVRDSRTTGSREIIFLFVRFIPKLIISFICIVASKIKTLLGESRGIFCTLKRTAKSRMQGKLGTSRLASTSGTVLRMRESLGWFRERLFNNCDTSTKPSIDITLGRIRLFLGATPAVV